MSYDDHEVVRKNVTFLRFCKILLILSIPAIISIWYYISNIVSNIPSFEKILSYNPPQTTTIYSSDGEKMAELAKENRVFVPIEGIPNNLKNAFIAAEDKTFYSNHGVDIIGLSRAIIYNMMGLIGLNDERYSGASTITQQVVRNLLLTNERTITRKLKEIIISYQITRILSKDRILEIYLNHIYLGSRSYGVAAASKEYFGKALNELTLSEMAVLASLPKAPSAIDPTRNKSRAIERRNWVLKRMVLDGFISALEADEARSHDIILSHKIFNAFGWSFIEYIKHQMLEYGVTNDDLMTNGYSIKTTMNVAWQKKAQSALDNGIIRYDRKHGYRGPIATIKINDDWCDALHSVDRPRKLGQYILATVLQVDEDAANIGLSNCQKGTIPLANLAWAKKYITAEMLGEEITDVNSVLKKGDVIAVSQSEDGNFILEQIPEIDGAIVAMKNTGEVLAMVGGYMDLPCAFNRAVQAKRQPGSAVKPFIYLSALKSGISPIDIFIDSEISFSLGGGQVWTPKNHNEKYLGPVTMRMGLELSLNTITIRVAETIGIDSIISMLRYLGISNPIDSNLSVALGTSETTLVDLAAGYATIANYGSLVKHSGIKQVMLGDSGIDIKDLRSKEESLEQILEKSDHLDISKNDDQKFIDRTRINPQLAYQMISILTGAVKHGRIAAVGKMGIPMAGKTGTSQNANDLWFVGFTPDVTIGVYVGFDAPQTTGKEYGNTVASPIFVDFITQIKDDIGVKNFRVPDGIKFVKINRITGKRTNEQPGGDVIYEAFKDKDMIPPSRIETTKTGKGGSILDDVVDVNGVY